ncbi:MAG: L,D-transpeptidase [Bacteriovoracia bacterium]
MRLYFNFLVLFIFTLSLQAFGKEQDKSNCDDLVLNELIKLLEEDQNHILEDQFHLSVLKMTKLVMKDNKTNLEHFIRSQAKNIEANDTNIRKKLGELYMRHGRENDVDKLMQKFGTTTYWKPYKRFYNDETSAFILAYMSYSKDSQLNETDAAITWFMNKLTKAMEKKHGRFSAKHNLTNLSNLLTRYTGVILGAEDLSQKEVQDRLDNTKSRLSAKLDNLLNSFSDEVKEDCLSATNYSQMCTEEKKWFDDLFAQAIFKVQKEIKSLTPLDQIKNIVQNGMEPPKENLKTEKNDKQKTELDFDFQPTPFIHPADNTRVALPPVIPLDEKMVKEHNKFLNDYTLYEDILKQEEYLNKLSNQQTIVEFNKKHATQNYVIVDKNNNLLKVFAPDGTLLHQMEIGLGAKNGDQITKSKSVITGDFYLGTTGAGIYKFAKQGKGGKYRTVFRDNIMLLENERSQQQALAIHQIPIGCVIRKQKHGNESKTDNRYSDGCINLEQNDMSKLFNNMQLGSEVFVLPEEKGNHFVVKEGKLHFTTETKREDYGVYNYSPKYRPYTPVKIEIYDKKLKSEITNQFLFALEKEKKKLMDLYNLDNHEYNQMIKIAFGILGNETEFGESKRYRVKEKFPRNVARARSFRDQFKEARAEWKEGDKKIGDDLKELKDNFFDKELVKNNSRGLTQIKKVPKLIAKEYAITKKDLNDPAKAAIATMGFLAQSLEQLKAQEKLHPDINAKNRFDYLPYIYYGKTNEIVNGTATPDKNIYIQQLKKHGQKIGVYQKRLPGQKTTLEMFFE